MELDKLTEKDSNPNAKDTCCIPGARQAQSRFDLGGGVHATFRGRPDSHLGAVEQDDYWDYVGNFFGH